MVHVRFEGEVRKVQKERKAETVAVNKKVKTEIEQVANAEVYVEFTEGHPNIDAFGRYGGVATHEQAESYGDLGEWEPVQGTWDAEIFGNEREWADTVIEYTSERPGQSLYETAIELKDLDRTDDAGLNRLISSGDDVLGFKVPVGELSDAQWEGAKNDLREATKSE